MATIDTIMRPTGRRPWKLLAGGLLAVLLGTGAGRMMVRSLCIVEGPSMLPTLEPGARLYAEAAPEKLNRGDVVVFRDQSGEASVKRIIGLPGEEVSLYRGRVFIDGRMLMEPYLGKNAYTYPMENPVRGARYPLGPGQYFVLGDNRLCSQDGRSYGPVARARIQRRVMLPDNAESPRFAPFTLPVEGEAMIQPLSGTPPAAHAATRRTALTSPSSLRAPPSPRPIWDQSGGS